MIQIEAEAWRGQHPAFPERPEALSSLNLLYNSSAAGVLIGTLAHAWNRGVRKLPTASLFASTGRYTALWLGLGGLSHLIYTRTVVRPFLEEQGITPNRLRIRFNRKIGSDDFLLGGAVLGALLAAHPRLGITARTPVRYIGGASWGAIISRTTAWPAVSDTEEVRIAERIWRERQHIAREQYPGLEYEGYEMRILTSSSGPSITPRIDLRSAMSEMVEQTRGPAPLPPDLPPAGSAPHAIAIIDGEQQWWPLTDYGWSPGDDGGIPTLELHMQDLKDQRAEFAAEAEFVWLEIGKKENLLYKEQDEEARESLMKKLEALGDIHINLWKDVSGCDWMIANTKKKILQLRALEENRVWLPKPQTIDSTYEPSKTLNKVNTLVDHYKLMVYTAESTILPPDLPEEVRRDLQEQLDDMRQHVQATTTLAKELELKIQEARNSRPDEK